MKKLLTAAAMASLVLTGTTASAETRIEKNEAKLAKMLEGRTAGKATSCISARRSNKLRVMENVGIIYESGDTIWVARTSNPHALGWNDVPVIDRFGSKLCNTDVTHTIDRYAHFTNGTVFLDKFVPYKKQA